MLVNDFIEATAKQLKTLFPSRYVFVDEIPQQADGNHFVRCIDQGHTKGLYRQRKRDYSFEVLYFQSKKDSLSFNMWAEIMYSNFESLTINGKSFRLIGAKARSGEDMVFRFLFDADIYAWVKSDGEKMTTLHNTEGIK